MLVVISIIGVLAGLSLPVFNSVRRTADKTTCIAHLKQIVAATNLATNDNNGNYPNMHGYVWEAGSDYIANVLAPYVGGTKDQDPTKLLRCPAAEKNAQEAWLEDKIYCHYKYNLVAQNIKPMVGYTNAMLFFDTTWTDWTQQQFAHYPGGGACLNVAYADGHLVTLPYADYQRLNNAGSETDGDFFQLGWKK